MRNYKTYIRTTINKRYFVFRERIKKKEGKKKEKCKFIQCPTRRRMDEDAHGDEQNFDATFLLSRGLTFINI